MAEYGFWQTLSDTIHRAVDLRVVTLLGDAAVQGTLEQLRIGAPAAPAGTLVTDINLVGGDITRVVSEKLLGAEFSELRTAHQESVKQAQEIVARNITILVTIAKEIRDLLGNLPPPSAGPART